MLFSFLLAAGLQLSARPDTLKAVTVVADRGVVVSRTDTLTVHPLQDVSTALQQLPGLYVGDYGSLAGLKSVSLRGFGSPHTAIYIDGIRVANIQSGQTDLGMLDLPSVGAVVADYAQNSLNFISARPVFRNGPVSGDVRLQYGSFSTWQPYGRLNFRLGERWSLSASAGGAISKGNFPLEDGTLRTNNDLRQLRGGLDLFGLLEGGDFHAKLFYNGADRGTPGSLDWPSSDRQKDRNFFGQFLLRKSFGPVYTLHLSGKAAYDKLLYQSEWGDSDYKQADFQLNSTHRFRLGRHWTGSVTADVELEGMNGNVYNGHRFQTLAAAAVAYASSRLKADLTLQYDGIWGRNAPSWNVLSPSADVRLTLVEGLDLVAFGRRGFRAPTFNELFYPGYGNPALQPEDGWLTDLGLDFRRTLGSWTLKARADGYYNALTNKIISAPTDDPAVWLPFNVGKVQAMGADLVAGFDYARGAWLASLTARYGWQRAVDKTPDSGTYGRQIAYVARHTAQLQGTLAFHGWTLGAQWVLRAGRYDASGPMPDYHVLDLTFDKEFALGGTCLGIHAAARNLLNRRYQIVSGYPMPGRNFTAGVRFRF